MFIGKDFKLSKTTQISNEIICHKQTYVKRIEFSDTFF